MASVTKDAEIGAAQLDFVPVRGTVAAATAELSPAEHLESKETGNFWLDEEI